MVYINQKNNEKINFFLKKKTRFWLRSEKTFFLARKKISKIGAEISASAEWPKKFSEKNFSLFVVHKKKFGLLNQKLGFLFKKQKNCLF